MPRLALYVLQRVSVALFPAASAAYLRRPQDVLRVGEQGAGGGPQAG